MVLRNKNIILIVPSSRGGYWKAHKTPNSSQAAHEFGNLDVSISWLLLATKNISPRQRPQTDDPWSELSHTQFGFCGYSSDWSNLVTDLHLHRMQETGAKATSIHELSLREQSSGENWGAAPNRDKQTPCRKKLQLSPSENVSLHFGEMEACLGSHSKLLAKMVLDL